MKILADPKRQVPAVELLAPASFNGALEDVISEYWNNPSMSADAFTAKFAQAMQDNM